MVSFPLNGGLETTVSESESFDWIKVQVTKRDMIKYSIRNNFFMESSNEVDVPGELLSVSEKTFAIRYKFLRSLNIASISLCLITFLFSYFAFCFSQVLQVQHNFTGLIATVKIIFLNICAFQFFQKKLHTSKQRKKNIP